MLDNIISHYRLEKPIDFGGMGIIYLAEDMMLKRKVAVKLLSEDYARDKEMRKRFFREARIVAALEHPNICPIYEIIETDEKILIAMPYLCGETLKKRISKGLTSKGILSIISQISEGLSYAHKKGVIHRDIKSSNIFISTDNLVKILDFGLAKYKDASTLTSPGLTPGTLLYMSPEQISGRNVDHRTDIWSTGVILYEMLTGYAPFSGKDTQDIINAIKNRNPFLKLKKRKIYSLILYSICEKCLQKNSADRYQTLNDLLSDLKKIPEYVKDKRIPDENKSLKKRPPFFKKTVIGVIAAAICALIYFNSNVHDLFRQKNKAIAVLPFVNMTADKDNEFLCDGITEELTNTLSKISKFKVIARTSAFAFKGKNIDVRTIGRQLGVDVIVEGSVRQSANDVRITVQLCDAGTGEHIWSEQFNMELKEMLFLQSDIAHRVSAAMRVNLSDEDERKISAKPTDNLEAYNLFLRGRYFWDKHTAVDLQKALQYYNKAIEIDPEFAQSYVGIADAYSTLQWMGYISFEEGYKKTMDAVMRALDIDDSSAEAHATLGWVRHWFENNFEEAEKEYKLAIKMNPNYWWTYTTYGESLVIENKIKESIKFQIRAMELNPLSANSITNVGIAERSMYNWKAAEEKIKLAIETDPSDLLSRSTKSVFLLQTGKFAESLKEIEEILKTEPNSTRLNRICGQVHFYMGDYENAKIYLKKAKDSFSEFGEPYIILGLIAMFEKNYSEAKSYFSENNLIFTGDDELRTFKPEFCLKLLDIYKGEKDRVKSYLKEKEEEVSENRFSSYLAAILHGELGNTEKVFYYLDLAYERNDVFLLNIKVCPFMKKYQNDIRYKYLVKKMNLEIL